MTMVESFVNDQRDDARPGLNIISSRLSSHLPQNWKSFKFLATGKISKEGGSVDRDFHSYRRKSSQSHYEENNFASFSDLMRFAIRNSLVEP